MDPLKTKDKHGPEWEIQQKLIKFLRAREWHVMVTHGNAYQSGFPDLYCTHMHYKQRWIDVKVADKYSFTVAQKEHWPVISRVTGIWILTAATEDEYNKLFQPPNWEQYYMALLLKQRGVNY